MIQLETSNEFWASVRQQHDEFVASESRELMIERATPPSGMTIRPMMLDVPDTIADEIEVAVRVLS